jgi:hypothetical protein
MNRGTIITTITVIITMVAAVRMLPPVGIRITTMIPPPAAGTMADLTGAAGIMVAAGISVVVVAGIIEAWS